MTTESPLSTTRSRGGGASVIVGAAVGSLGLGLAGAAAGAVLDGSQAAAGALVGSVLAVGVMAFGASTVHVVAGLLPAASLAVALLTYALQLLLVLVVLAALDGSALMGDTLSREWLAGALICTVLAWVVVQVVLAMRARIPLYGRPSASARPGGER